LIRRLLLAARVWLIRLQHPAQPRLPHVDADRIDLVFAAKVRRLEDGVFRGGSVGGRHREHDGESQQDAAEQEESWREHQSRFLL
jgi:hypothetical protein